MPPRAWVESERHVQMTPDGSGRATERGVRRAILDALEAGNVRVASLGRLGAGVFAALLSLERDGAVQITHPLTGGASAYRTVRVAALTAQGIDIARNTEGEGVLRLGARQREAVERLSGAPDGLDTATSPATASGQALSRLAALGLIVFSATGRAGPAR